jgi:hypothetical protein
MGCVTARTAEITPRPVRVGRRGAEESAEGEGIDR